MSELFHQHQSRIRVNHLRVFGRLLRIFFPRSCSDHVLSNNINKELLRQNRMQIDNWSSPAVSIHPSSSNKRKMGELVAWIWVVARTEACQDPIRWKIQTPTEKDLAWCYFYVLCEFFPTIIGHFRGNFRKLGRENAAMIKLSWGPNDFSSLERAAVPSDRSGHGNVDDIDHAYQRNTNTRDQVPNVQ